jgi:hypothetical protein
MLTEDTEDAWAFIDTIMDLSFAVAVCFATATVVYTAGYFAGVWR